MSIQRLQSDWVRDHCLTFTHSWCLIFNMTARFTTNFITFHPCCVLDAPSVLFYSRHNRCARHKWYLFNGPFLSAAVAFLHVCTVSAAPCCHGNFIVYSRVIREDLFANVSCEKSRGRKKQASQALACKWRRHDWNKPCSMCVIAGVMLCVCCNSEWWWWWCWWWYGFEINGGLYWK